MALTPLFDKLHRPVQPGDRVILLYKEQGYCKISNAFLVKATYTCPGPYGYEFYVKFYPDSDEEHLVRLRKPDCVLVTPDMLAQAVPQD